MKDAGGPQVAIRPVPGTTPEQASNARVRAWSFIFQCWREKQKGDPPTALKDDIKELSEYVARTNCNAS